MIYRYKLVNQAVFKNLRFDDLGIRIDDLVMAAQKNISCRLKHVYVTSTQFFYYPCRAGVSGSLSFWWYCYFLVAKKIPDLMRGNRRGVR